MATSVLGPRALARKRRILRAAESLFARQGVESTTVEDLLQEAGIARATFYRAFSNMDEVVEALYDEYIEKIILRLQKSLEGGELGENWLARLIDDSLENAHRQGPILGAIFREELRPESVLSRFRTGRVTRQVELLCDWWHQRTGFRPDKGLVTCMVLMVQNLGVHVSMGIYSEQERRELSRSTQFIIRSTMEGYVRRLKEGGEAPSASSLPAPLPPQASTGSSFSLT